MRQFKTSVFVLLLAVIALSACKHENIIVVKSEEGKDTISRYIYGHFAEHLGRCIYNGIWVGEDSPVPNTRGIRNDVVEALREIEVPVLRWPGGCFADNYHWKNGIGPKEKRPPITNFSWGYVTEDNSFGTHEFLDLCDMIGAEPYIAVNVGSGTVREAAEWVEYVTSDKDSHLTRLRKQNGREEPWKVKFWGIGNESWGCGGNMDPSYYLSLFKKYSTFCRVNYKVASSGIDSDLEWTETVMKNTIKYKKLIQGYSYHHYTVCHNWDVKGSATDFNKDEWFLTVKKNMMMEKTLKEHISIMDKYDPEGKIGLIADEWGNWHDPEPGTNPAFLYQQNTLRDAISASLYLNIFNNNCRRVKMANIAQTVNVLQSMVLTREDELVKTPSFYVFKMYKQHRDALMLPLDIKCEDYENNGEKIPALSASASQNKRGEINITVTNVNPDKNIRTSIGLKNGAKIDVVSASVITAEKINACNDFGKEEAVNIKDFTDFRQAGNSIEINLPSKSVVLLTIKTI
jgi:alpha-N-arabinofuranosidase